MSDHAGAQVAPPSHKRAIENSQRCDHQHLFPALVLVDHAKHESLQNDGRNDATRCRPELLLKVSAINNLFADPGGNREKNPQKNFREARGRMVRRRWRLHSLDGSRAVSSQTLQKGIAIATSKPRLRQLVQLPPVRVRRLPPLNCTPPHAQAAIPHSYKIASKYPRGIAPCVAAADEDPAF